MPRASILALSLVLFRVGAAPSQEVRGSVYDGATRAPVAYAEVLVLDESGRARRVLTSDARGSFTLPVSVGETVRLRVRRLGYDSLTLEPIGPVAAGVRRVEVPALAAPRQPPPGGQSIQDGFTTRSSQTMSPAMISAKTTR